MILEKLQGVHIDGTPWLAQEGQLPGARVSDPGIGAFLRKWSSRWHWVYAPELPSRGQEERPLWAALVGGEYQEPCGVLVLVEGSPPKGLELLRQVQNDLRAGMTTLGGPTSAG